MTINHITYNLSLKTLDIYLEKSNGKILHSSRISRAPRQYMRTCAVENLEAAKNAQHYTAAVLSRKI